MRAALTRAQEEVAKRQAHAPRHRRAVADAEEARLSARGELALARVKLEKLTICAPIDGTVLQININPGELAAPRRFSR